MNGVSVIICCYNAEYRIEKTLDHLQKQKFTRPISWEVIIVDNASTDNTSSSAEKKWNANSVTELKIVYEPLPGLMHARHKGLETARYDIVSFIDDDNWVEDKWVEKIAGVFLMDEKIGACGGRSEAVFENVMPGWFPYFENSFAVGKQADKSGYVDKTKGFLWGAGLSFRRSIWLELKRRGFKNLTVGREGENITAGEDTELCYAFRLLDYSLYYHSDLLLYHFMPGGRMQFSYLEKMCFGFGKSFALLNSYRVLLDPAAFQLHPWFYEWIATQRRIITLKISSLGADQLKQWQVKTKIAYWKGYASQVWKDKDGIKKNILTLKSVFIPEANP